MASKPPGLTDKRLAAHPLQPQALHRRNQSARRSPYAGHSCLRRLHRPQASHPRTMRASSASQSSPATASSPSVVRVADRHPRSRRCKLPAGADRREQEGESANEGRDCAQSERQDQEPGAGAGGRSSRLTLPPSRSRRREPAPSLLQGMASARRSHASQQMPRAPWRSSRDQSQALGSVVLASANRPEPTSLVEGRQRQPAGRTHLEKNLRGDRSGAGHRPDAEAMRPPRPADPAATGTHALILERMGPSLRPLISNPPQSCSTARLQTGVRQPSCHLRIDEMLHQGNGCRSELQPIPPPGGNRLPQLFTAPVQRAPRAKKRGPVKRLTWRPGVPRWSWQLIANVEGCQW